MFIFLLEYPFNWNKKSNKIKVYFTYWGKSKRALMQTFLSKILFIKVNSYDRYWIKRFKNKRTNE